MEEGNEPKDEEDVEEGSVINSRLEEEVSNTQSTKENDETLHLDHTQTNKVLLVNKTPIIFIFKTRLPGSGGRQAAISHNIFPFDATYYLFCLPAAMSHNRTVFHATAFESSGAVIILL